MFQGVLKRSCRLIHTSALRWQAADKAVLSKLRKKTGFPITKCQKALGMFDNDFSKAEVWLKEQAQKEGWAKAQKLQDRPMSQGLVGVTLHNNTAAMIEVNCETDFVARNNKFQKLVSTSAAECLKLTEGSATDKILVKKPELEQLKTGSGSLADLVALCVGDMGENMALRRAVVMRAQDGARLGTYVHSIGQGEKVIDDKCIMGKYGAIVVFHQGEVAEGMLPPGELGKQLCQHVVGMNPTSVGLEPLPEDPSAESPESVESGEPKPEESERKKKKKKKSKKSDEEELRLLYQEFLLDPDLKVRDFLEQNNATVLDFARLECGEEIAESV